MDVSVVLPVVNERDNIRELIPRVVAIFQRERLSYEVVVVDGGSTDGTREEAERCGARVVAERRPGYSGALETGLAEARGDFILTLDADLSHEPDFITKMWRARTRADIVIASRYARGGMAYTDMSRRVTSAFLNRVLRRVLSMPVADLSSGYRLYRRAAIEGIKIESNNYEVLEEILIKAYARGYSITEVPFTYFPRGAGRSHARLFKFGAAIALASIKLWKLRNSLESADYDERAFYSIIPVQRYWQRRRHRITVSWARRARRVLDAGCGSSIIVQSLNNVVGMDFNFAKLRFLRRYGLELVNGSAFALPFRDASFDCVISSQVIEHIPFDDSIFTEMARVLEPGGTLILGTPDYATRSWRIIEPIYGALMPGGYRDEHITHYTHEKLRAMLPTYGFVVDEFKYIGGGELILRCHKDKRADESEREPRAASNAA